MVPTISIIFICITFLATTIVPVVVWIILAKKTKGISTAIIAGAIGFFVPQIIIRLPILQAISMVPGFAEFVQNNAILYSFLLGLTAALFETAGRICVFYFMRKKLSYNFGLGAGFGHGALEAVYIVGLTYLNNLIFAVIINTQGLPLLTTMLADEAAAQALIETFVSTPPETFLVAMFERLFTVFVHIALSLLVCYGFIAKKVLPCAIIAVASHTLLDTLAGIMSVNGVNIFIIEFVIFMFAIGAIFVIINIKKKFSIIEIPIEEAKNALSQGY